MIILNCPVTGILLICVFLALKVIFIFQVFLGCCNLPKKSVELWASLLVIRCLIFELWPLGTSRVWLRKLSGTQVWPEACAPLAG
jgi:hypothetical protein